MSFKEPIDLRAERFRVLLAAIGEEPSMRAGEGSDYGLAPGGWSYSWPTSRWRSTRPN